MLTKPKKIEFQEEDQVASAAEKYYRLFGKDWAEQNQLDPVAQEQLLAMLQDAYFFIQEVAADEKCNDRTIASAASRTESLVHD